MLKNNSKEQDLFKQNKWFKNCVYLLWGDGCLWRSLGTFFWGVFIPGGAGRAKVGGPGPLGTSWLGLRVTTFCSSRTLGLEIRGFVVVTWKLIIQMKNINI